MKLGNFVAYGLVVFLRLHAPQVVNYLCVGLFCATGIDYVVALASHLWTLFTWIRGLFADYRPDWHTPAPNRGRRSVFHSAEDGRP